MMVMVVAIILAIMFGSGFTEINSTNTNDTNNCSNYYGDSENSATDLLERSGC